jgi:predicted extracellular nuclease
MKKLTSSDISLAFITAILCILSLTACNTNAITPSVAASTVIPSATIAAQPAGPTIAEIQGVSHFSPFEGESVVGVQGVVTALRGDGYYIQSLVPDNELASSEGLLIFTKTPPRVKVGDLVSVSGNIVEFYASGSESGYLPITELVQSEYEILESELTLPEPTVIGLGGRMPPSQIIDNDSLERFDPNEDGIDFYESMESMLVQINNAVAVGSSSAYKEIPVVADNGDNAGLLSAAGTLVIQKDDFNPERILLDDSLRPLPLVITGDYSIDPIIGIMDYTFGAFKLQPLKKPTFSPGGLSPEIADPATDDELSIATFNVENLDPLDSPERFDLLAIQIVDHLQSPDLITLVEVQDNNGAGMTNEVDASLTYQMIIDAVLTAGGPTYEFRDIPPQHNQDGGEAGGNIRVGFLFRTDRGLTFVDRPGGDATTAVQWFQDASGVHLSYSPGRIDPQNPAFLESRKPLAGEFIFRGQTIFVVANHFNSKGGDTALFGEFQPPLLTSEFQRIRQAQVLHNFVSELLTMDPQANIVITGDLNDFQFSAPLTTLLGNELTNLVTVLPAEEQYTYVYEGNAQALDHVMASANMFRYLNNVDIVHINAPFTDTTRLGDHDPVLVRFILP